MNEELERLLQTHGSDVDRWPVQPRADLDRLLAVNPAARDLLRLRQFDVRLARHLGKTSELETQAEQIAAARILAALAPLPEQQRRTLWNEWSSALLDWDFMPAWPRIAALAGVALLGFAIGLVELAPPMSEGPRYVTMAEPDVGAIVFEPEPLTGSRP